MNKREMQELVAKEKTFQGSLKYLHEDKPLRDNSDKDKRLLKNRSDT